MKCRTKPQLDYLSYRGKPPIQPPSLTLGFHVLWFGEDGTKTDSAFDSSLTFTAVTHSAISHRYIFFKIPPKLSSKTIRTPTSLWPLDGSSRLPLSDGDVSPVLFATAIISRASVSPTQHWQRRLDPPYRLVLNVP